MKNFLLIVNRIKSNEATEVCFNIEKIIKSSGGNVQIISGYVIREQLMKNIDCAIVLGGDGTLLQASRSLLGLNIPLIGVNLGHLGFLADVETDAVEDMVNRLMSDDYVIESRMMLDGAIIRNGEKISCASALNDIVVGRSGVMGVLDFKMFVNGIRLNSYKADGIIASTPTGSTAYSMSAGGPLVKPSAQLIVMTPVCPHTLNTRSIVLEGNDIVELEICQPRNNQSKDCAYVYFDGELATPLVNGDIIQIKKSKTSTDVVKIDSRSFLEVLRRKLNSNEDSQT